MATDKEKKGKKNIDVSAENAASASSKKSAKRTSVKGTENDKAKQENDGHQELKDSMGKSPTSENTAVGPVKEGRKSRKGKDDNTSPATNVGSEDSTAKPSKRRKATFKKVAEPSQDDSSAPTDVNKSTSVSSTSNDAISNNKSDDLDDKGGNSQPLEEQQKPSIEHEKLGGSSIESDNLGTPATSENKSEDQQQALIAKPVKDQPTVNEELVEQAQDEIIQQGQSNENELDEQPNQEATIQEKDVEQDLEPNEITLTDPTPAGNQSIGEQSESVAEIESSSSVEDKLKVTFQLKYSTKFGQNLFITANHKIFGNNDTALALPMQYYNQEYWYAEVDVPKALDKDIIYNYYIVYEDGSDAIEWGSDKVFNPAKQDASEILLVDLWNYAGNYENTFFLEPFTQVLLRDNFAPVDNTVPEKFSHTFKIKAPFVTNGQALIIVGNIPELGSWDFEEPLILGKQQNQEWWSISLDLSNIGSSIEYKYAIYDLEQKKIVRIESGDNRVLQNLFGAKEQTIVSDGFAYFPNNSFKGAGVAIPVFSLRSNSGLGVGEFNDLKLLVDWAKNIGLKLVQILPINDTTATYTKADSYPYAAISAFALHPIYLNLATVVNKNNKALLADIEEKKHQLNSADTVNYEQVVATKFAFLKQLFPLQKEETFKSPDFEDFFNTNSHWLVPYAAFCYFRDKYNTSDYNSWPENNVFNSKAINKIAGDAVTADDDISIHYFIQYHLHVQLKAAAEYAHENGIIVKGDIPIGIFRNSCDAWQQPELYNMDRQAGAPPDDFAVKGQNWGFPTYNWQAMAQDGFRWWKRRFEQMSYYFDAFRIDHILGFFRIWSIPMDAVEGIMGHFVPALPVHISELHQRGILYGTDRFTEPFINDAVLWEFFGNEMQPVKKQFLTQKGEGLYALQPEFDTQRKVEEHFNKLEQSGFNRKLKQGLFDLISNVILFSVEGSEGQQFHFRISIENTTSFNYLDDGTKHNIWELYINYFYRRQDNFWREEAMKKLPELKRSTNMLICGEDLGMVPASVPGVMNDLAILSLEIQRMPKDPNKEFFHPKDAPYLSVVTPSTHDMSTIRGWWEEDNNKTQRFFNNEFGRQGQAPATCDGWINKLIIIQHLYSPAMWSIFQLQDLLGIDDKLRRSNPNDERINIPADPKHYWRYRMHLTLEDLMEENEYNFELKGLVSECGR